MEQAVQIIRQIETPLQITALALLVLYGIAKALIETKRWTPSEAIVKLLLNRAFQLAVLAFVLSIGGPLAIKFAHPDVFIEGSVFSAQAEPLENASVAVSGIGSQAVHRDGTFEIRIPDHLRRGQYSITATSAGYKTENKTVLAANLGSVDFQLSPQPEHAIRQVNPEVLVGQFYGVPVIAVSLTVKTPANAEVRITDMSGQLSNGSVTVQVNPSLVTLLRPTGPYVRITGPLPIIPGPQQTMHVIVSPAANIDGLTSRISSLPDYAASRPPCLQRANGVMDPLTDGAYELIKTFATERFVWSEGTWSLHLRIVAGDQEEAFDKQFHLSADDVKGLRESIALTRTCMSINTTFPLAQDGPVSNFTMR